MMGLWADGWFYISSAGLCISGVLFFFLLGQYRVASEAADATEGEQAEAPATETVRPVYIPDDEPRQKVASHAPEAKTEAKEEHAAPRKDPSATTGGISPAVVYMQNIKVELAALHDDVRALAKRVDNELAAVSTRDEALIERLAELTRAVEGKASSEPAAAAPAPSQKKARKEKAPEPAIELGAPPAAVTLSAPKPEPVVEAAPIVEPAPVVEAAPVSSPEETIRMDLGSLIAAQESPAVAPGVPPGSSTPAPVAEPEPAPAAAPEPAPVVQEPPQEEKPRRGPVWPV